MNICFHENAFEDYIFFQKNDKKIVERINKLLKDITREPFSGIGKPEALKHNLSGFWSRRISSEHRLVYAIKDSSVYVLQCRYHY
jgi:toxin YoeB